MTKLRIGIDARLTENGGGVAQFVLGLAHGLSQLEGEEEYFFLMYPEMDAWLKPYLSGNCHVLYSQSAPHRANWTGTVGRALPIARKIWHRLATQQAPIATSDGTIERAGVDLMHFTFQYAFLTEVPSIYHPHDLQHVHLPEFFTPRVKASREALYRRFCEQARMVAVASSWGKADLIKQYHLPAAKVQVVPLAPSTGAYPIPTAEDLAVTRAKYALPQDFVLYPAQTWPHKNHLRLLEALAIVRDRYQVTVPFVSCGYQDKYFHPQVERRMRELQLERQVQFLGFVTPLELQALYRLCRCVVIPTKFEAASFPLWETFLAGAPAACSNVTSLPQQAGDAALIFDPDEPDEIAQAIQRLWTDRALCETLIERGRRRVAQFTWDRTARLFRAHYRRIALERLEKDDEDFLESLPLL
jgi:glycosyltransferase involved in cell wall biosynthesis